MHALQLISCSNSITGDLTKLWRDSKANPVLLEALQIRGHHWQRFVALA